MSLYVVDASVAAKWFFNEDMSDRAMGILQAGNRLYAPDHFPLEMDNVFCKRVRRGDITEDDAVVARAMLREVSVEFHHFALLQDRAFEIAIETRHSPYGCLYVVLAMILGCRAVTADRRFCDDLAKGTFGKYVVWLGDVA